MDKQTYKIAVVGNRDAILPFRLIGFQTYPVTEPQEAINTLRKLSQGKLRDYLPDRGYCSGYSRYSGFYDQQLTPALILIPTHRGTTGLGQQRIRDNVEKAVGQDIL